MADSTNPTVYEIFQSMEQGPAAATSTATAQAWLDHHSRSLGFFMDGKFILPADRRSVSLTDSKGGVVCSTACAEDADISQCASSAAAGWTSWSSLSCSQRAKALLRLVGVLGLHGQCVSELCALCEASCSPAALVRLLQYYSSWAQLRDMLIPGWTPVGVVVVVSSDDCSLYPLILKVLPALAMGNSVIVVPGRSVAPPTLLLAQLFTAAGLPAGTLNILTGSDVTLGAKVSRNPDVRLISYCGNKQDGLALCEASAGMGVPVSISSCVGATCPFIIFESADIDSAVDEVIQIAFKKKKEVHWVLCVQESVSDSVVARLKLRMADMKSVPLSSDADRVLVDAAVQEALQQGATLVQPCGASTGARYPPTVLCGAAPSSPYVVTPPPGPLLPLLTFRSNTEAVLLGNHSPHGHAASIWTEDLTLALETAKSLSVGSVWVNSSSVSDPCFPVSGHKDSGTGTDGGQEGLYQFLRPSFSSPLPCPSPVSLEYSKFGTEAAQVVIPDSPDGASIPQSYPQFVGGKACKSVSGCSVAVQAPGGDSVLVFCPDGGRKDVRNAVEAAIKVQPGWMKKSPSARAQSLYSLAKGLESRRKEVCASLGAQLGVPAEEADREVELSVGRLNVWAAYCDKVQGGSPPMTQSGAALSFPEPLGVVGIVLPDDAPLLSLVTVLGAAIATGNAVVMVPSQRFPLPALAFVQVLQSSDLPAGLVNIITGNRDQLTVALANHSVIKAIWYWGSAQGCQYLQHTCTSPLKTLRLSWQQAGEGRGAAPDWAQPNPSLLEDLWRNAVQWKSVWIPTA
ncbi:aldehyde dehydrogenase family 16 member A1 [Gambusia affinis]|uniref:aldehyde dehydrogenase family 16 member A1 n=1 Tax=Gambusia affinis TaxID=33528 RepID=UPI001CDB84EE|nr:aldehyde dehydrogenase family 16 member A1 [Gambusia affinis]XP_043955171.1 aldehyde dehydrogenase family 16 member A1 [Gambusia affinis]